MDLSGELARSILDAAPDPTIIADETGTIVFANAQIRHVFGYEPNELVGEPVEKLLPARYRAVHPEHRARFLRQARPRPMGPGLELYGLHKDGNEFPVEISLSPVATESGLWVSSAIRDVSAQKDTARQLAEANRAKSRLLAAASHDLRQPLQALSLLNQAAASRTGHDEKLEAIVERQRRAIDSMGGLLSSLLDLSKLDSGVVVPELGHYALAELWEDLKSEFEDQALAQGLEFFVQHGGEVVYTDRTLLKQLLANLLANAIRCTQTGSVGLRSGKQDSQVRVEVLDTGRGIPEQEKEKIFEEFYQIDWGSQRREGLGLGLSIVRRLSQLLGYVVEVDSTPGRGSVFAVLVPQGTAAAHTQKTAQAAPDHVGGLILIIDDEPAVAEATGLLLELEGFDVRLAACAADALRHVEEEVPDLMISDYQLRGGETGLGVVASVRKRMDSSIPVIFVTGDMSQKHAQLRKVDRSLLLTKPLRADELLAAIRRQLVQS